MATVQTELLKLSQRVDPRAGATQQVFQDSSAAVAITNATNTTPIVLTAANHGRVSGDLVYVTGVGGNTAANNTLGNPFWVVTVTDANTLSLNGSIGNAGYTLGGTLTGALIGSVDGNRFTRQRLLDIYNDARIVVAQTGMKVYGRKWAGKELSGAVQVTTTFQFTAGVGQKISGYLDGILLYDTNKNEISIVEVADIPFLRTLESSSLRFVIDTGQTVQSISGNTFIPDASTYTLWYYGIPVFTLSDVLGGVTTETLNDAALYILLEIAEAIANEVGTAELNALARKLFEISEAQ